MSPLKIFHLFLFAGYLMATSGCVSTSKVDGVDVSTNFQGHGIKMFQVSPFPLYQATLAALKKMNLKVDRIQESDENYQVVSKTEKLNIIIDLENVGTQLSRMRVRAEEDSFFSLAQDEKMAAEIIKETALVLEAKGHFNY